MSLNLIRESFCPFFDFHTDWMMLIFFVLFGQNRLLKYSKLPKLEKSRRFQYGQREMNILFLNNFWTFLNKPKLAAYRYEPISRRYKFCFGIQPPVSRSSRIARSNKRPYCVILDHIERNRCKKSYKSMPRRFESRYCCSFA